MKNKEWKRCTWCGLPIISYNKKRKSCYECKKKYPFKASNPNSAPFNRKQLIKEAQRKR